MLGYPQPERRVAVRKRRSKVTSKVTPKVTPKAKPAKVGRPSHGPHMKRKNLYVDQRKLDEAREALGVATETEAIDEALSKLTKKHRVLQALKLLMLVPDIDYAFDDDRPSERDLK